MNCRCGALRARLLWIVLFGASAAALFPLPAFSADEQPPSAENAAGYDLPLREDLGTSLFDGRTLDGWQTLEEHSFKRHGEVAVEDGRIVLYEGGPATGIRYTGDVPRLDYELTFQAMRVEGNDFFCGLTFPVADSFCSFIVGGWGGATVGLSCLDGLDASDNETSKVMGFGRKR